MLWAKFIKLEDLDPFSFVYKPLNLKIKLLARERDFIRQNDADDPFCPYNIDFRPQHPKIDLPPSFINFPSGGPFSTSPPCLETKNAHDV